MIRREEIYSDVLGLYNDFSRLSKEFPFRVAFEDEIAVDSGGVLRDMFSGFWDVIFKAFFDGAGSLIPATHPNVDMSILPVIGRIMSHGYITCGFLPVHISFPIIATVLLGLTVQIDEKILRKSYIDHVNYRDASILRTAFQHTREYSPQLQSSLVALVSAYGCRQIPTQANLSSLITDIARHEFLVKPVGAVLAMHSGIPEEHRAFWSATTIEQLFDVYVASNATASTVLSTVLCEPIFKNSSEESAYGYLVQYIGNLREDGVRDFLRFVTGSSALVVDDIYITFNGLGGLSRWPIAHTCSSTLELSTTFATYIEFSEASELSWFMDAM